MPVSPALAEDLAAAIGELYASAETSLIGVLRDALAEDIDSPLWAELKLAAVGDLRRAVETVTDALQEDADGAIARALATAYDRGAESALADLGALPEGQRAFVRQQLPNAPAVDRLARSMTEDTRPLYVRITRAVVDAFRSIVARVSGAQILTGRTRRQASQEALDEFAARGITGFVDKAGRSWQLASYAEMAVRSVTARAVIEGHTDQLTAAGIDLVMVSDAPLNCPLCEVWEGEVLTLTGSDSPHTVRARHAVTDRPRVVHVAGSLRAARAEGLFHPNAILGNQQCRALGDVENAARAWYEGPSIHLTTARGKRLTVSPNHPVLTTAGWLAAERVREGMYVLSAGGSEGDGSTAPTSEDLHDAPTSFEEVFDAVAAHGCLTRVAAAADDFHGDGRSYKGEVDVVWAEGALLDVLQPLGIEEHGERGLVGSGVQLQALTGRGALLACGHRVVGSVAGALADLDAVGLETSPERRVADAEDASEVLAGLACGVTPDQVVNVERDWYRGHAYDLQTSTGAYLTADIVVHNCRHSLSAYLPGVTTRPESHPHPQGATYKDTQQQRYLERQVRAWKRRQAAAMDDAARRRAGARVRAYQARIRELTADKGLRRKPPREQIGSAR